MTRTIKNTDCFEYLVLEDKKIYMIVMNRSYKKRVVCVYSEDKQNYFYHL